MQECDFLLDAHPEKKHNNNSYNMTFKYLNMK